MPEQKTIDFFSQSGPWAVLAVIVICAVAMAAWRIYQRMANALDDMHRETVKLSEKHTDEIKLRDDRIMQVVDNNTKVMTAVEMRLSSVEEILEKTR